MLKHLRRLLRRLRLPIRRRLKSKIVVINKSGKNGPKAHPEASPNFSATVHPNAQLGTPKPIRVATFNAALFSMAPALPKAPPTFEDQNGVTSNPGSVNSRSKSANERPRSILKHSQSRSANRVDDDDNVGSREQARFAKSKMRVSINLPDNEISLLRSRQSSFSEHDKEGWRPSWGSGVHVSNNRTVVEVLKEVDADVLGLQDVKAEEENGMKPLSDLAAALGMNYVFAESWAPEYGNAVLSKWPIKRWNTRTIFDHTDFRNVLKATIDVPQAGELNFYCTHLDHLDENWRMKQVNAIIQSSDEPHILAGGLNSLDESDYSQERWTDIVKYYEEMGKPTPKVEVMKYLKSKDYTDAKDYAGECESVVMIAKGQSVQGTCKYGTRVDYILSSSNSPYKFVPGSYLVLSSKGTSDHHIVKVDVVKANNPEENVTKSPQQPRERVIRITQSNPSKGIWKTHT
ncbi:Endonuclease/exonuclease/phosphatase protein [Spatholobus suberectus]|nr:Endonuclease/exonuclease/phosphatase protein [Spatholobus suberectus]